MPKSDNKEPNPPAPKETLTTNSFSKLAETTINNITATGYLSKHEYFMFSTTSRENYRYFAIAKRASQLLAIVMQGNQMLAERLLSEKKFKRIKQELLIRQSTATDLSGRTFTCSPYEYAYWAKDTHMCRMLASHMNDSTKAGISTRIDALEDIGLTYQQATKQGPKLRTSKHFNFTRLITALQRYTTLQYDDFADDESELSLSGESRDWKSICRAQRQAPSHVIHEYLRTDRSLLPRPTFNEPSLPRTTVVTTQDGQVKSFYGPTLIGLVRGNNDTCMSHEEFYDVDTNSARDDLAAIQHLDTVRTAELVQLRENLQPAAPTLGVAP